MVVHMAYPVAHKQKAENGEFIGRIDLQTALNRAAPGDVVQLTPGVYRDPVVVFRGGREGAPVTIRGPKVGEPAAIFDGGRTPPQGATGGLEPMDGDWAFMKLFGVRHVILENLSFRNCWPQSIYIRGVSDFTVQDTTFIGSRYAIYARSSEDVPTERLLLQRLRWVQDPDFEMARGVATWREVKAKRHELDKSWFNGGLFGSFNIPGDVTIRDCDVSHAFNGVRMDISERYVDEAAEKPRIARNKNVLIYRNRFAFIRDNAVEPEMGAEGWLIAENQFVQVHATLSLDGVTMRDVAFVSNRVLNVQRPGKPGDRNTGGKIIKFLSDKDFAVKPGALRRASGFVSAFNSAQTRTRYVSDAALKPWTDRNNAVERFEADERDDTDLFSKTVWRDGATVDAMATNDAKYPEGYNGADVDNPGGFAPLADVFRGAPPELGHAEPLGGWDGRLTASAELMSLKAAPVTIYGPRGRSATVGEGLAPGYQSLETLGISDWLGGAVLV